MECVSLKLDSALAREVEKGMKSLHYSTKTEFIREAIRDRLAQIREQQAKEKAWERLFAMRGSLKGKGKFKTYEEWHDWRSGEGSRQLEEFFKKKFGLSQK